ncbi:aldo/keto reductase [Rubripirellula reticaptiva]|uniref:L-glyceraldehyde 3-phosphate reductase n=1 Tax=Rubripirellula reticaptiva TaxID=2528013 RepID=A0A5C6EDX0_9BACT|nr:aldo/keto reductase [Rubripirellula reticaptiva]TWU47933.1 L-glyceraldehyde 3-phosphate reductase [Rubripirellula reticaptiva]
MKFNPSRYDSMVYRRCGNSGLRLPVISLGGWQGIGSYRDADESKRIFFTAFDHGITHFDFANNYGNPAGASEALFGQILTEMPRHELVISSKAGYPMWPGPYGDGGGKKYLIESCEQSLKRLGVDYVDIFYSHRVDLETPLEETLGALETLVRQGKALYTGLSNYPDPRFADAVAVMIAKGWSPITIHQPRYNLFDRAAESSVFPTAARNGVGVIAFSPLAQGLLTARYLSGIPSDSRAAINQGNGAIDSGRITDKRLQQIAKLNEIANQRGQTLGQMALSWILRDQRVTSVLTGASHPEQIIENIACLQQLDFADDELVAIDWVAIDQACAD